MCIASELVRQKVCISSNAIRQDPVMLDLVLEAGDLFDDFLALLGLLGIFAGPDRSE